MSDGMVHRRCYDLVSVSKKTRTQACSVDLADLPDESGEHQN